MTLPITYTEVIQNYLTKLHKTLPREALSFKNIFGRFEIIALEDLIFSGTTWLEEFWKITNLPVNIQCLFQEGDLVLKDQTLAILSGPLKDIALYEDFYLTPLQKLSGLSSLAHCYFEKAQNKGRQICYHQVTPSPFSELYKRALDHGGVIASREADNHGVTLSRSFIESLENPNEALQRIAHQTPVHIQINSPEEIKGLPLSHIHSLVLYRFSWDDLKALRPHIPQQLSIEVAGDFSVEEFNHYLQLPYQKFNPLQLQLSSPMAPLKIRRSLRQEDQNDL